MQSVHPRTYQLNYDSCENEIIERSKTAFDHALRTETFYRLFVAAVVGLCLYSLVRYPLLTVAFFFLSYFAYQISFMVYHSSLHAQFVELDHKKLLTGPFIAFVHHYVNPRLLCCREHRNTYQSFIVLITLFPIFALCFLIGGKVMIPYVSTFLLWHLSASPVHEWYHLPPKNRKDYFNRVECAILNFLENRNVISTKRHVNHHRHHINNKQDVIEFDDSNVGEKLSKLFDHLWQFCWRHLYRENKKRLTVFYSILYVSSLVLVSGVAVVLTRMVLA